MATAKETYTKRQAEIKVLMKKLTAILAEDAKKFKNNDKNWGYVGSIGKVKDDLKEIIDFIGS
jgi:hypothetical protein